MIQDIHDFSRLSMTAAPMLSPHTLMVVLNRSSSQSTASISPIPSIGSPKDCRTIIIVTSPAWGMLAAPIAARVAVRKTMTSSVPARPIP